MTRHLLIAASLILFASTSSAQLAARWSHALAIAPTGQVYSWGWNDAGQAGIGSVETVQNSVYEPKQ